MSHDPIVEFYRGRQPDGEGRSIEDVWAFNHTQLEDSTNYLEWLFPLGDATQAQPGEPIASKSTTDAFASDAELRQRLRRSLDVMLEFYGLCRDGDRIRRAESFESRHFGWLYPNDHNHHRLSRIVQSLALLAEPELARSLRDELVAIADDYGAHSVSRETRGRWAHLLEG